MYSGSDDDELYQFDIIPLAANTVVPSASTATAAITDIFFFDLVFDLIAFNFIVTDFLSFCIGHAGYADDSVSSFSLTFRLIV